ncbi:hypothetical protein ACFFLS_19345 [Flavobacterium procerum]|uniref:DUF4625 domain-containing protein n=1 Tax=Flavobacterium procerum TaxID=1455569 RepID=A0ABV6BX59_9FLAO
MKSFFILLILIFSFSCQQKKMETSDVHTDSNPVKEIKKENLQINDTLFLKYKNKNNQFTAEGSIDSIHSRIYVKFSNEYPSQLIGKIITPEEKANIRFNQIIFPDKTSDDPFESDLKIDIKQKGFYILVIGHSQMAENPYWGKFEVQLQNININ